MEQHPGRRHVWLCHKISFNEKTLNLNGNALDCKACF